jgi:hypothetical protein
MIEYGKLMRALRLVDKACDVWLMKRAKINKVKADYWDGIHAEEKKHRYLQQETAASVPPEPSR